MSDRPPVVPPSSVVSPPTESALPSGLAAVQRALQETEAVGFVHVGDRHDADRRYLTRVDGPDRETAVVVLPGDEGQPPEAVYCVPTDTLSAAAGFERESTDELTRRVDGRDPATPVGRQIQRVLAERFGESGDGATLLVPRDLPHDTAVFCQQAGYELRSTPAVTTARATKTPVERDCLRAVGRAAAAGIARGEAVLAASQPTDGALVADGRPLTVKRLVRLINAELALTGVSDAGNTRVTVGCVEDTTESSTPLEPGAPIVLSVRPRGPRGYHGLLTRTLVVDGEGGWERRAYVAAEAGLTAAEHHIEVGVGVSTVRGEALAELGAYGFAVAPETDESDTRATASDESKPRATARVHGTGLSAHEPPAPGHDELGSGSTIVVETGVEDPTRGTVRLGTTFVVTEDGTERLVAYPTSMTPVDRRDGA
ncbi:MAG: M24 family metallopeptidase [Natrialbaceae archaeon]